MKQKTCCFTGHRTIPLNCLEELAIAVEREIAELLLCGVTDFISGGALGFDTLAAELVLMFKKTNSAVRLIVAVPCRDQQKKWNAFQKKQYADILGRADEVIYLAENYYEGCMRKRNEFMVDRSAHCIAYFRNHRGGTQSTIKYARESGTNMHYV